MALGEVLHIALMIPCVALDRQAAHAHCQVLAELQLRVSQLLGAEISGDRFLGELTGRVPVFDHLDVHAVQE
jgi:hypothetical protein